MNTPSLLLVEDDPQDEMLALRALRRAKLTNRVTVVRDGQQALDWLFQEGEFASREGGLPAVVLLDINLPRLSGLEVLKRVREDPRTALLPVVILTSSDEQRDQMNSWKHRCNSFVRKPLAFGEFSETVARLGLYWLTDNRPAHLKV